MPTQGKKTADGGKMARRKKKKLKHRMNEKTYTDKTNVSSEADLTSDEETTITKTSNQNTESSATEPSSDEETNSTASKRKPSEISPPELQPQPKIVNFNTTEITPEEEQSITSLSESDKLVIEEFRQRTDGLNSTYISQTTNVTKDLHMDISDDETERNLDAVDGHKIIETSKLVLPTLKEVIDEEGLENGNSEKRIAKKGDVRPGCSEFTSWLS